MSMHRTISPPLLILLCAGALTTACNDDTTNTDEVGDSETDSDSTDGSTTSTSTSTTEESTTDESTTEESTTDTSTADESTTDTSTTEESTTSGDLCGNGTIDLDEECDDGNDVDTDECPSTCLDAVCGDSFVFEGTEECDDGNDVDDDECANDCTVPANDFLIELANPDVATALVDDGYNGTQDSMTCAALDVVDEGTVVEVTAVFGITHTFAGDLTAKLISPNATVVTMFSRPGLVEMGDNGMGCCGESANLSGMSPLSFADAFMDNPENMGGPLTTNQTVCLDDLLCDYQTNPGSATPGTMADFAGESVTGEWTFCVADSGGGDTGQLAGIGISILASPP